MTRPTVCFAVAGKVLCYSWWCVGGMDWWRFRGGAGGFWGNEWVFEALNLFFFYIFSELQSLNQKELALLVERMWPWGLGDDDHVSVESREGLVLFCEVPLRVNGKLAVKLLQGTNIQVIEVDGNGEVLIEDLSSDWFSSVCESFLQW